MWLAPLRTGLGDKKMEDLDIAMHDWGQFVDETQVSYGVNMNVLTKAYRSEHEKYYLKVCHPDSSSSSRQ
jgi:type I protein arginine methyltransferase